MQKILVIACVMVGVVGLGSGEASAQWTYDAQQCSAKTEHQVTTSSVPAAMIMVDRSGSMGWGWPSRWSQAKSAVNAVTSDMTQTNPDQVEFGLGTYRSSSATIHHESSPNANSKIMSTLNSLSPGGGTPTGKAIKKMYQSQTVQGIVPPTSGNQSLVVSKANNGNKYIPDNCSTVKSYIYINQSATISQLKMDLTVQHSYGIADLTIDLVHGGKVVNLSKKYEGFKDTPSQGYQVQGWQDAVINDFNGMNAAGVWELRIKDCWGGFDGSLDSWRLDIYGAGGNTTGQATYTNNSNVYVPSYYCGSYKTSVINVPTSATITDIKANIYVNHSWGLADFTIDLLHGGTSVNLTKKYEHGTSQSLTGIDLPQFDGMNMSGVWELRIQDCWGGFDGSLDSWSLEISYDDGSNPSSGPSTPTQRPTAGILITDGYPNNAYSAVVEACNHRDIAPLYVVGLSTGTDKEFNDLIAAAGGTGSCTNGDPCNNPGSYWQYDGNCNGSFQANNATQLAVELSTIANQISCSFPLELVGGGSVPASNEGCVGYDCVYVSIDGGSSRIYHASSSKSPKGWTWADSGRTSVKLDTPYCNLVQSGQVSTVETQVACLCAESFGTTCNVFDPLQCECATGSWACDFGTDYCEPLSNCPGGLEGEGGSCSVGVGACENFGADVCTAQKTLTCSASPGTPVAEVCDNIDNNCNGQTDEGLFQSCGTDVGVCQQGVITCSNGAWGSCVGAIDPTTEVCDGLDNDCNGLVDDLSTGTGQTTYTNDNDVFVPSYYCGTYKTSLINVPTSATISDIKVNIFADHSWGLGDFTIDLLHGGTSVRLSEKYQHGTSQSLTGVDLPQFDGMNMAGVWELRIQDCWGGFSGSLDSWSLDISYAGSNPPVEVCGDGVDNNCDGQIDEGCCQPGGACSTGLPGRCGQGVYACDSNGNKYCEEEFSAVAEVCNGIDDDCDGEVDNLSNSTLDTSQMSSTDRARFDAAACYGRNVCVCPSGPDDVEGSDLESFLDGWANNTSGDPQPDCYCAEGLSGN